ncbi:MAG: hypothetical protein K8H89_14715 [Flavobacteriales bacterium]|jgi:hypothetical protein|nr:hypothetical protein [Flavobacteriales bacterium]MCB0759246.1 hypothetical protein [Flavobacteriales bacterium]
MRLLLFALLSISSGSCAWAQTDTAYWTVQGPVDLFTTDELGNLYTVRGNDLDLFDRHGVHLAHNSLNAFGLISRIDAFSSMKPMIFSRNQGQLALLDNTLSIQGNVMDLSRNGYPQVTLVCTGVQGRFWFFDERDLALMRVDGKLNQLANTGRLDQLLSFTPQPTYMEEANDRLYMVDPEHGVLVFDLFGTYVRTLPILGADRIQVREGFLWYVHKGRLERYDLRAFTTEMVPWPQDSATAEVLNARIEHGRLYRQTPEAIRVSPIPK